MSESVEQKAKALRFLADELEAGNAQIEMEIREEPKRRFRQFGGAWTIRAITLKLPGI